MTKSNFRDSIRPGKFLNPSVEQLLMLAEQAVQDQDWPLAVKRWRKLIRKYDGKVPSKCWVGLGRSYLNLEDFEMAKEVAREGIKSHPAQTKLHVIAGKAANAQEDWNAAINHWSAVIDQLGSDAPLVSWLGLVKAYRLKNDFLEAKNAAKRSLGIHAGNVDLLMELAEIETAQKNWNAALEHWDAAFESHKKLAEPNTLSLQRIRLNQSVIKRLLNIDNYKKEIKKYAKNKKDPKVAVVTSMTKGYDEIKPPEFLDSRIDYYVYTDDQIDGLGIFTVNPLPKPEMDNARSIRYVKTHPHVLLKTYDAVVWADASLMIVGDIYPMVEKFLASNKPVGSGVHPLRKSIYEELEANIQLKKENADIMKKQVAYYKSKGFTHDDLSENTLLMFNNRHPKLAPAMETWWEQICTFSRRDQLSFNYSLAQNGAEWFPLTRPPEDIRHHPCFVMTQHHTDSDVLQELINVLQSES